MQVVILCGGYGTRLREETEYRPKPMVNVGTKPILWHIMSIYSFYGHKDFVLALGYKGEMIKEYFFHYHLLSSDVTIELGRPEEIQLHKDFREDDWKVTLVDTGEKAYKGARLKRVERYIDDDTFMLTYGDGVADIDIKALLDFHRGHGKMATITGVNLASRFGELDIKENKVEAFREKAKSTLEYVNGGFFVFNRGIFGYLTPDDYCDLEIGPLEIIASEGQLMVYKHTGNWACMDTPRDRDHLNDLWEQGNAFWKIWKDEA